MAKSIGAALFGAFVAAILCSNHTASAASRQITSARLLVGSQRHLLHVGRITVNITGDRPMRARIAVTAVETIPGRMLGRRRSLTRGHEIPIGRGRMSVRLPLTRRGGSALRTCARYRLSLWIRTPNDARGIYVPLGPIKLDTARCQRFFALDGVWNRPLSDSDPIDPTSRTLVAALKQQVDQAVARRYWPTINTTRYSTPVYEVPENQPHVRVTLDDPATYRASLRAAFRSVPVPEDAKPAAGNDEQMVVWQPSTDTMWEFFKMRRAAGGWHARLGGKMPHVSKDPGYFDRPVGSPWGATAPSLPLLGGLIFPDELARGRIDHALAIAIPRTRRGPWSLPAQRGDGWVDDPNAIPEGTRFRVDPRLDIDKLILPKPIRAMAFAAQRYGIIVRDTSPTPVFYAEDPTPTGTNPYPALFDDKPVGPLLAQLPWGNMQAMRMQLRRYAR